MKNAISSLLLLFSFHLWLVFYAEGRPNSLHIHTKKVKKSEKKKIEKKRSISDIKALQDYIRHLQAQQPNQVGSIV